MTSLQINCFLAVVQNKSFTKAAEELYLTQPAISRHISSLESELEFSLFDRSGRQIRLTPAGELFHSFCAEYRASLSSVLRKARFLAETKRGALSVGILNGWDMDVFFPRIMNSFSKKFPHITVRLENHGYKALCAALRSGKVDVIVSMDTMLKKLTDVSTLLLAETPHMLIFSKEHPCASLKNPVLQDFSGSVFYVSGEDGAQAMESICEFCAPYDFTPSVRAAPNSESVLANVRNGLGVTIMGSWSQAARDPRFRTIPLRSSHKINLIWSSSNQNPAVEPFVQEVALQFGTEENQ